MPNNIDDTFLSLVNVNIAIAHKVARVYFQDEHDREDVVQEMLYQLYRSYPGFTGKSKFSTWMYKVCLNTALTAIQTGKSRRHEPISATHEEIAMNVPNNNSEELKLLFEAISDLSPLNKAIVLLYLEDMSYEEIAGVTGISRSNVSVRLVRIKKELEAKLSEKIKDH